MLVSESQTSEYKKGSQEGPRRPQGLEPEEAPGGARAQGLEPEEAPGGPRQPAGILGFHERPLASG